MTTVAFIGLGIMGGPMAGHLVAAGFDVVGYNRSQHKIDELVAAGGRAAESVADAVADADIVAVMVPDSPDVQQVLAGDGGVFDNARPGTLIIDFSSIRPDVTADLATQATAKGLPAAGRAGLRRRGRRGQAAALSIMVGGDAADFQAAADVFAAVGKTIVHVGPSGAGQTVKAANQLIVAVNIQVLAEAVPFLQAYGVDTRGRAAGPRRRAGRRQGAGPEGQNMLARSFAPGFRIALHHKDLGIVTSAAREAGVVIPLGAVVAQLMASALASGDGGLDHSALLRGVLRLSGRDPENITASEHHHSHQLIRRNPHDPHARRRRRRRHSRKGRRRQHFSGCPERRSTRSTPPCATTAASSTSWPGTSRAPRTWPRATPGPRPATSASASAPPDRPAPT